MKSKNNFEVNFINGVIAVKTGNKLKRPIGYDEKYEEIDEVFFYDLNGNYFFKNVTKDLACDEFTFLVNMGFHPCLGASKPIITHNNDIIENNSLDYGIYLKENPFVDNKIKVYRVNDIIIVLNNPSDIIQNNLSDLTIKFYNLNGRNLKIDLSSKYASMLIETVLLKLYSDDAIYNDDNKKHTKK